MSVIQSSLSSEEEDRPSTTWVTEAQRSTLLDYLEDHRAIAVGYVNKGTQGRSSTKKGWTHVALLLNSMTGPHKTPQAWAKYWSQIKNRIRKKIRLMRNSAAGTGGGQALKIKLSENEERAQRLLGTQFGGSIPNVRVPLFPSQGYGKMPEHEQEEDEADIQYYGQNRKYVFVTDTAENATESPTFTASLRDSHSLTLTVEDARESPTNTESPMANLRAPLGCDMAFPTETQRGACHDPWTLYGNGAALEPRPGPSSAPDVPFSFQISRRAPQADSQARTFRGQNQPSSSPASNQRQHLTPEPNQQRTDPWTPCGDDAALEPRPGPSSAPDVALPFQISRRAPQADSQARTFRGQNQPSPSPASNQRQHLTPEPNQQRTDPWTPCGDGAALEPRPGPSSAPDVALPFQISRRAPQADSQARRTFRGQNQPSSSPASNQRQHLAPEPNQQRHDPWMPCVDGAALGPGPGPSSARGFIQPARMPRIARLRPGAPSAYVPRTPVSPVARPIRRRAYPALSALGAAEANIQNIETQRVANEGSMAQAMLHVARNLELLIASNEANNARLHEHIRQLVSSRDEQFARHQASLDRLIDQLAQKQLLSKVPNLLRRKKDMEEVLSRNMAPSKNGPKLSRTFIPSRPLLDLNMNLLRYSQTQTIE